MALSERARKESTIVLGFAALILAAASAPADASPSLTSATPWWEKVTYVIGIDGEQQACRYESSIGQSRSCGDDSSSALARTPSSATAYTKITIERRFTPGSAPERIDLHSGDTLLGGQIMSLAIGGGGEVRSCNVVGRSGDVRPDYGCDQLRAERFQASASRARSAEVRQGFMTILVYGHKESLA